jgi:hypothetical protein
MGRLTHYRVMFYGYFLHYCCFWSDTAAASLSSKWRKKPLPTAVRRIRPYLIDPSTSVGDLGIFLDTDLSMWSQVLRTVADFSNSAAAAAAAALCAPINSELHRFTSRLSSL